MTIEENKGVQEEPIVEENPEVDENAVGQEEPPQDGSVEPVGSTSRGSFIERMKSLYPDVDFDDEEARYRAYAQHEEEMQSRLNRLTESDKKMSEVFQKDPRFAQMLIDINDGEDPVVSFYHHFGDIMEMDLEDEEVLDRVRQANAERVRKAQEDAESQARWEEEREANFEKTNTIVAKFLKDNKLSDEDIDGILESVNEITEAGISGLMTEEVLSLIHKARMYDKAVEEARNQGLTDGRNQRIALSKARQKGDGLPHVSGKSTAPVEEAPKKEFRVRPSMYQSAKVINGK